MILDPRPSSSERSEASLAAWTAWSERPQIGASVLVLLAYGATFYGTAVDDSGYAIALLLQFASWLIFTLVLAQQLRVAPDRRALLRRRKLLVVIFICGPIGGVLTFFEAAHGIELILRAIRLIPLGRWLLRRGTLLHVVIAAAVIVLVAAIGFARIEQRTFGESLYWAATAVTIGPQNLEATKRPTELLTVILAFLGLGFFGAVIGSLTAYVMQREQQEQVEEVEDEFAAVTARLDAIADRLEAIERRLPPER